MAETKETFSSILEGYRYLSTLCNVSEAKFRKDKKEGKVSLNRADIVDYALSLRGESVDIEEWKVRKTKADCERAEHEARIARVKADEAEREIDRKWLYRDDVVADMAATIATIQQSIEYSITRDVLNVIEAADGNQNRVYDTREAISRIIAKAFNEVANMGALKVKWKQRQTNLV